MQNEANRILKLFTDLQHGYCWIGTNFKETLHGINAVKASAKPYGDTNSIWEIISHLIYWRTEVKNRLNGNNNPPTFIDFRLPEQLTDETWKQTLRDFEATYHSLRSAIHSFKDENLDKPSPKEGQTYY